MVLILASSPQLQLLNRGFWGPPLLGAGSLYSILSPTALRLWTPTAQSGVLRDPLLCAGSLYSILSPNNSNFLCTELYYYFTPTQFNLSTVKVIPLIPSTGCTCYLLRWISYFDSSAEVSKQHFVGCCFHAFFKTAHSKWCSHIVTLINNHYNISFWFPTLLNDF